MAVLSRFYQPARGQYQSQFVPRTLPVDLMAKTLYGKQAVADQRAAEAAKLGEWTQRALEGYDTKYVKGIEKEVQDFAKESLYTDRTSPEFQRKYMGLVQKIKKDEGLKSVSASVAKDDAFHERVKDLKKKGDNAYAAELEADYLYRRGEYTKEGGKGYTGNILLGDENILEGRKQQEDAIKFFTPMQESGADTLSFLGSGIAYKKGWTGITDKRVRENADRTFKAWMQTDAGKQDFQRELQKRGYVNTTFNDLSPEDQEKVLEGKDGVMESVAGNFLAIGRTIVHGKSTTNIDEAYNTQRGEEKEKLKEMPVIIPTNEKVTVTEASAATRDSKIKEVHNKYKSVIQLINEDKDRVKNGLESKYTKAGFAQLQEQARSYVRQEQQLKLEKNEDYNRLKEAQTAKVMKPFNDLLSKQQTELNKLKGLIDPDDFKEISQMIGTEIATGTFAGVMSNAGFLDEVYQSLPGGQAKAIIGTLKRLEAQKEGIQNTVNERVDNLWAQEYHKEKTYVTTEPSGVTIRTDKNSTAAAVDKDIATNPESWQLTSQNNAPLKLNRYTTILGAQSNSAADISGQFNTTLHLRRPKTDSEGNIIRNKTTDAIEFEEVFVNAKAAPVNEDTKKWINNKLANEQFELSNLKKAQGFNDEAELAFKHATTLNRASVSDQLQAFRESNNTSTMVSTNVKTPTGSAITEIYVEKIDDGGKTRVSFKTPGGNIEREFNNQEALDAWIQTLTGL